MYYTYVLQTSDRQFYIGQTVDLIHRFRDHNHGRVTATKHKLPVVLVYYEACLSHSKAIEREKQLKTGYGRAYLNRRIK